MTFVEFGYYKMLSFVVLCRIVTFSFKTPVSENLLCTLYLQITMCGFRKYPYPPQENSLGISRGRMVSKAKVFKRKYKAQLQFPEGWVEVGVEAQTKKTFHEWGMSMFWNTSVKISCSVLSNDNNNCLLLF